MKLVYFESIGIELLADHESHRSDCSFGWLN
jgi:hypothetical protein